MTEEEKKVETEEIKKVEAKEGDKIDIFRYLMDRDGADKTIKAINAAVETQGGKFYKFPEGLQDIVIVEPPKAVLQENAKYADKNNMVFRAVIKEIAPGTGIILDIKYPLTLSETRLLELAGAIKAVFPEWNVLTDQGMEIARDLKIEASTAGYVDKQSGEDRSKTRFTVIKGDDWTKKTLWIKELNEKKSGVSTNTGTAPESVGNVKGW